MQEFSRIDLLADLEHVKGRELTKRRSVSNSHVIRIVENAGKQQRRSGNHMKTEQLIFVGIKGTVVAVDRATGQQVWATRLKGSDFVNVLVQDGAILASCRGEIFCLDPLTGEGIWHNPLKGFGIGLATIATAQAGSGNNAAVVAEKRRRDAEAAAAGAAASS